MLLHVHVQYMYKNKSAVSQNSTICGYFQNLRQTQPNFKHLPNSLEKRTVKVHTVNVPATATCNKHFQ